MKVTGEDAGGQQRAERANQVAQQGFGGCHLVLRDAGARQGGLPEGLFHGGHASFPCCELLPNI